MSPQTVLVTGGTGFLGSHVIAQLLEQGYKVKAATRSEKKLRSIFPDASAEQFEVFEVSGLMADHSQALKGVDALIHLASPVFTAGMPNEELLHGAYNGALSIVETALKVGVKKIIVTSTIAALDDADFGKAFGTEPVGPDSWGKITSYSQIDTSPSGPGPMFIYQAAKTASEHHLWQLADQHPEVDFTTLLPSAVFGPFVPNFLETLSPSNGFIGNTNSFVQALLDTPDRQYPENVMGLVVDVRDAARAHVLALTAPPLPNKEHKRLITSNKNFTWDEVVRVLRANYPESVGRRLPLEDAKVGAQLTAPLDTSLTEKVLGFGSYIPAEKTYVDTLQAVLDWEKRFKA